MKRSINFTRRKRILLEHVDLELHKDGGECWTVRANFELASYEFPDQARIYLEAFRLGAQLRFACGTIASPLSPFVASLAEMGPGDSIAFRVKVVDESEAVGKLLGVADKVRPADESDVVTGRQALLPTRHADLEELPWRVAFETVESHGIVLEVNRRIEDRVAFARSPEFRQLALPAVVREVLTRALIVEGYEGAGALDGWRQDWVRFVTESLPFGPDAPPDSTDERCILEWIDEAVSAFSRAQRDTTRLLGRLVGD